MVQRKVNLQSKISEIENKMILKQQYITALAVSVISLQIQISSLDYITRLALLIQVFMMSGFIYKLQDFKFLGLTYIIVYVGAISIQFIFVIKMTESGRSPNIQIKKLKENIRKGSLDEVSQTNKNPKSFRTVVSGVESFLNLRVDIFLLSKIVAKLLSFSKTNHSLVKVDSVQKMTHESLTKLYQFYVPSYTKEFLTYTDIETLGFMIYLAYPLVTLVIGVLLWCVLIGILRISGQ